MNDQKREQLAGLLELMLDGSADEYSKQKVIELLRDDPDAQQWYIEYCQVHTMLAWEHGALPAFVFDVAPQNQSFDSERLSLKRLSRRWQWLAICASILFAFSVGMLVYGPLENHPVASVRSGDQSLQATRQKTAAGVVLYADQAVWKDSTANVAAGDLVFDEPLRLSSGTVQIALFGGATITLDGPCQLDLYSSTRGYLQQGNIFVSVKNDNVKLEIDTPVGQMVHLGTEFGVSVAETGETDMFVFDGAVELKQLAQGLPAGSARVVYEGQAMRLQTSGRANTIRHNTFEARRAKYEDLSRSKDLQPRPLIVGTEGYELRYVKARSNAITSLFEADRLLSGNIPSDEDWTVRGLEYINFQDRGIRPNNPRTQYEAIFPGEQPFPGDEEGIDEDDDNFVIRATADFVAQDTWVYSFLVNVDDGARLRIDGQDVIVDEGLHGPQVSIGTVVLRAGHHTLELVAYENTRFSRVELGCAAGETRQFEEFSLLRRMSSLGGND